MLIVLCRMPHSHVEALFCVLGVALQGASEVLVGRGKHRCECLCAKAVIKHVFMLNILL